VRATGGFLARVLTPAAARAGCSIHFLKRRPWELLERQPRIAAIDLVATEGLAFPVGLVTSAAHPLAQPHGQN